MNFSKILLLCITFCLSSITISAQNKLSDTKTGKMISDHIEDLSKDVGQSVVQILVTSYGPQGKTSNPRMVRVKGSGSGAIVDPNGYIITNAHVVEGAVKIKVKLSSALRPENKNREFPIPGKIVSATLVGLNSLTDIAVLKIEGTNYPTLEFGDSQDIHQGKMVFAFGSPLGLDNSVTMGIISTPRRYLSDESPIAYIQTDASINPGNSGGPLVDVDGNIIGINTMIISQSGGSEGIGFAIPSRGAEFIYNEIKTHGYLRLGTIGAMVQNITPLISEALDINQEYGVIVSDVLPGSPSDVAGLKEGDVILAADGKPVIQVQDFTVAVYLKKDQQRIALSVLRGAERFNLNATVVEKPDPSNLLDKLGEIKDEFVKEIGLQCVEINATVRQLLPGTRKSNGIIITGVMGVGSSWNEGILPGDIIYSINRQPMYDIASLTKKVKELKEGDAVVIHLERKGRLFYLPFEIE